MTADTPRRSMQARGFLFADLRGYTSFVEARGDEAAEQLLRTYRAIVRDVIARFEGAEIRTEGDSFYVVFPSGSDAVLAGLAILDEAARPSEPLRVGIGVHAGEARETDEGHVGWAVNVAARVCGVAHAGELLVTDTVRGLTRGHAGFAFVYRGRRRLKGVAEPLALYAVTAAGTPSVPRRAPARVKPFAGRSFDRVAVPVVLAVGVLVLTAGAIALFDGDLGGTAREQPTQAPEAATVAASPGGTVASPTPEPDPAAEREAANERLAARIDPAVARLCRDADPDDAPDVVETSGLELAFRPLETSGGLRCDLGGAAGPDLVYFWEGRVEERSGPGEGSEDAFFALAGRRNLPPGDCTQETRAWGEWEFGASSRGLLLCSSFGGEALLMWTYEGTAIIAQAIREDGDSERLYRWWLDHARVLGPEPAS